MSPLLIPLGVVGSGNRVPSGGVISAAGAYIYHTFTATEEFKNPIDGLSIEYLVVAGGGSASASYHGGGGGGAGGLLNGSIATLSKGNYTISVGAGGATTPASNNNGYKGANSSIGSLVVASGGGAGIMNWENVIANGGSGGGACNVSGNPSFRGTGISGQGNDGGSSFASNSQMSWPGGGGGGAGQVGQNAQSVNYGGKGGDGLQYSAWATATATGADGGYYAGGGAGGINGQAVSAGIGDEIDGGLGGGGHSGVYFGPADGEPGTANTGGGGGAPNFGNGYTGGAGGSGIVIIRYLSSELPGGPSEHWLSVGLSTEQFSGSWFAMVDNDENSYNIGLVESASTNGDQTLMIKRDVFGEKIFDVGYYESSSRVDMEPRGSAISNTTKNIYITSYLTTNDQYESISLFKLDSSGNVAWARRMGDGSFRISNSRLDIDDNENIYISFFSARNPASTALTRSILKFNSSGALQWWRDISSGPYSALDVQQLSVNKANGDIYLAGRSFDSFSVSAAVVIKINTSGTLQWTRQLLTEGSPFICRGGAVDSNGNFYASITMGTSLSIITKFNSSGTIVWQRQCSASSLYTKGVAIDSDNNIYVLAANTVLFKFDTDGNLLWQRSFGSWTTFIDLRMAISDQGNMFVPGTSVGSGFVNAVAKLPSDGSKTGTYGNFQYTPSAFSFSTYSAPWSPGSYSLSSTSFTPSTIFLGFEIPTINYTRTDIR